MRFPNYTQLDAMDCGPTSLRIVAQYYGRHYSLQNLRERCHLTREGVRGIYRLPYHGRQNHMGTASRPGKHAVHRPLEPAAFRGGLQDRPQTRQVAGVCFRSGIGTARILRGAIPEGMDTEPGTAEPPAAGDLLARFCRFSCRLYQRQRHRSASGAYAGLLPRERRRGQAAETGLSAAIPAALQKLPYTTRAGDAHGQRSEPDPAVPHAVGRGQGHRHGQSLVRGDDARRAGACST